MATVREDGATVLATLTPSLELRLSDADESVRVSAAVALASQKPEPGTAAGVALARLAERQMREDEPDLMLLTAAISGLAECLKCAGAERAILKSLDTVTGEESRRRLILAIGEGRSHHAAVIERLTRIAQKEEGRVRLAAVLALGNYGPPAKSAVPVLTSLFEKAAEDTELEQALGSALKRILQPE